MHVAQQRRHKMITTLATIAIVCATTVVLAACGGSSSRTTSTQQARPTPAQSNPDVGSAQAQGQHARQALPGARLPKSEGVQRARSTPATTNDENGGAVKGQFHPCALVSSSEAAAITGGPIAGRVEAPLGPTCIYRLGGSKSNVTVAVESINFSQVRRQMTNPNRVIVRGRQAYCARLGTEMLFVPLSGGRVLNVTAPCAVAQRFAVTALSRLTA